mmetsp:Transcript_7627/g.16741  ORF Transcript_7627/g.16741 Transcript_7627/m.16741 type:complete len:403 (+) Transcript_7627:134-1342(+)|eukprot:CAMPEP_0178515354 /NCGR_PEP_ID=MMETSP0696-20121128/24513_1 /TAXON_ID=265572 /ORGANISM="Extubocellulus spinifer, Strain CCMP396" /LENGTH=402 /DNA_ID=CAMNT_0020145513 /DNA_START=60 /DNA_END=1268 /DNA_ORIENTATION=-
MASKAAALKTSTNAAKRKADDDAELSSTKKLKSHKRTMTMEQAKQLLAEDEAKRKVQNKIIRNKQKEIRELKKKLKEAEDCVKKAKAANDAMDSHYVEAEMMALSDSEIIISMIPYKSPSEKIARNAMDDMLSLGNDADIIKLAGCIRDLGKESLLLGALKSLLAVEQPSSIHAKTLRILYIPLLQGEVKPTDRKTWPVIASAMTHGVSALPADLVDADSRSKEYELLYDTVLQNAKLMKEDSPLLCGNYNSYRDNCPIIDLLHPTYEAITHESGNAIKAKLKAVIKEGLTESINEVQSVPDHSMPTEAEIAGKNGFPDIQRFLLSPTETSIRLNLTKSGRMEVHRLIDNKMCSYGKLRHCSKGTGRDRCLVVTKSCAEPPEMIKTKEERKQKHKEMLDKME